MQPYFLPYLGYFQLMRAADVFVVYDDIQFTKKGWGHRNRMLVNGEPALFTLPLKHDSAFLDVVQRELSDDFPDQAARLLRRFEAAYHTAPFFANTMPLLDNCLRCSERNLFRFLMHSLRYTAAHLGLLTPLVISSTLGVDRALSGEDRVIATCRALGATEYLNPPGGRALYHHERFIDHGIALRFLDPEILPYEQLGAPFVSHLSIADVLMFNPPEHMPALVRAGRIVP